MEEKDLRRGFLGQNQQMKMQAAQFEFQINNILGV